MNDMADGLPGSRYRGTRASEENAPSLQFLGPVVITDTDGRATISCPPASGLGETIERAITLAQDQINAALAGADAVAIDAWHEVHEQLSQARIAVTRAKKVREFATADVAAAVDAVVETMKRIL